MRLTEKIRNALDRGESFSLGLTTFQREEIDGKTVLQARNWHGGGSVIASWYPNHNSAESLAQAIYRNRQHYRQPCGVPVVMVDNISEPINPALCPAAVNKLTLERSGKYPQRQQIGILTRFTDKQTFLLVPRNAPPWAVQAAWQHHTGKHDALRSDPIAITEQAA